MGLFAEFEFGPWLYTQETGFAVTQKLLAVLTVELVSANFIEDGALAGQRDRRLTHRLRAGRGLRR